MNKFVMPQKLYYGENALNRLGDIIEELRVKKVFLLTDPILKELCIINPVIDILENKEVSIHLVTNVVPEPSLEIGNQVVQEIRDNKPDLVIGIGGGSALDLAKSAAVLSENDGSLENYLNLSGDKEFVRKGIPKVLIPTTSGTGAEVTDIAVFSLADTKDVITHDYLLADYAIVDASLTYSLPPKVTAASGIDALTHALESYTSVHATRLTETLALDAMKMIIGNIRVAVWNGNDKEAREQMALGSLFAGLSFYNAGVAGIHGLAYPLGGLFKIPHGESNAVLMPYVYDYIWPACIKKLVKVAGIFNLSVEGKSEREIAQEVVRSLLDLVKDVGLPTSLKEYQINEADIPQLTKNGMKQTRLLSRSPKPFDEDAVKRIYTNAYHRVLTNS